MTVATAARTLGIADTASMNGIHARFRELAKEWHPDTSPHDPGLAHEMFIQVRDAYEILLNYCANYEISFREEDIRNGSSYDSWEFWVRMFGDDPIWG